MRLGELISPAKVNRCGNRELPILSITKQDGIVLQSEKFKKKVASADVSSYKVVPRGKLVQGIHIDEANFGIQNLVDEGIVSPAYKIWDVNEQMVLPEYLAAALRSEYCIAYYRKNLSGTVHRRGRMSNEVFYALEINVPTLNEQLESMLTLGEVLAEQEAFSIQLKNLDELVKSRFVEMFGLPTEQHEGWEFDRIDVFCDVITGNTPSRKKPEYYGDYIEWIKTDNITDAVYLTEASEGLSELGASAGRVVPAGSVLMACIAGSVKSIGKVAIANRSVAFNQQINALVPHEGAIETEYLLWMLRLSKDYLCSDINMQLKGILNKSNLSKKAFSVPPLALQQEFAAFVQQVDKLKFSHEFAGNLFGRILRAAN